MGSLREQAWLEGLDVVGDPGQAGIPESGKNSFHLNYVIW